MRETTVKHGRLTWRRWYGRNMRLHSAFKQQKGSGLVFGGFWGHSRLWPPNQKKASLDPFHENMVRKVYMAKISGPYQLFYGTLFFLWYKWGLSPLFFFWLTRIFQRITRLIRINRVYCEYGQYKLLQGFVRLLMWRWLTLKKGKGTVFIRLIRSSWSHQTSFHKFVFWSRGTYGVVSNIMIDHYDILLLLSTELRATTIDWPSTIFHISYFITHE